VAQDQPADEQAERRDRRKKAERERIPKHGRELGKVYKDAVVKRARRGRPKTPSRAD
jgi:hypothetical protein